MTERQTFTDEELVAYLDGEVEFTPADAITAALANDPALAQRLADLDVNKDALRSGFDLMLDENQSPVLPQSLHSAMATPPKAANNNWLMAGSMAASILVALFVGYGAGNFLNQPEAPGWKAYVASYQSLYSADTLRHVNASPEAQTTELERVAAAIGKSIDLAALQQNPDLTYKRAQVLSFKGKPLVQLAFLTKSGEPVALCILKSSKPDSAEMSQANLEGMSSASWNKDGYAYLLIGGDDPALISGLANSYRGAI
ncbi:MAG: hypothetical protein MJH08_03385 [Hyphomicrobiales bacterium]|nr:hypothetical protein [Hyphomicrobiales bacterium]